MAPRSREELLALGKMDPYLEKELARNPLRGPEPSDPYYGRDDFSANREHRATTLREKHHLRFLPGPVPDEVKEEDRQIVVRDGEKITVRIYSPTKTIHRGCPLIVMLHEGGWSMGDLSDEEVNCKLFSRDLGAVCVNVDYRLAPEHKFPTGINDCWDALQWAARDASLIGATPDQGFVVGGGSAGGNIAAVLCHLARDTQMTPVLTGQYLCVPAIMCLLYPDDIKERYRAEYLSHPSVTTTNDPVFQSGLENLNALVEGVLGANLTDPLMVPFQYGKIEKGHAGLPAAYFQVAGLDPLRDEALIYERVLREEFGVRTKLDVYPGLGHYFWTNFPGLAQSKQFVKDTVEGMRWLLSKSDQ